jgi:Domain of unknown function (DUF4920)
MSRLNLLSTTFVLGVLAVAGCDKGPKTTAKTSASAPAAAAPAAAAPAATGGATFGAALKLTATTPIASILADPKSFAGQSVKIEGMVVDVCAQRGCWMDLAGAAPGEKLKFKVVDGEMTFPVDAKGKWAVAEGVVSVKELSLEDSVAYAKYQAEEAGAPFDPATVTKPMTVVKLDGTGAQLRDKQ